MNYLVAVLTERQQAEDAYQALEREGIEPEQVSILGQGHETADEFGLIHPNTQARRWIQRLLYWLVPFGFIAGYAFNFLTEITIISGIGAIANHIIGGLFGAVSGALGAVVVGGAVGWTIASGDATAYRNRLNAGKYLIIVRGSDEDVRKSTRLLRLFEPENLQGYEEQDTAELASR